MPGRDRTGPQGAGPMTGRAAGPCTESTAAPFAQRSVGGRGRRGGWGGRGGRRRLGWQRAATAADQPDVVAAEAADPQVEPAAATPIEPALAAVRSADLLSIQEELHQLVQTVHELRARISTLENGATA